jgi:predicted 3-demethylubiquinone-9 3-methyltransferase (glyoxalase superfamily)
MQKITTFLWFDNNAQEAAEFYVGIFRNSKITNVLRRGDAGPATRGSVLTVNFQLEGQEFIALNGGPHFKFSEAISLFVSCETQQEIDTLWEQLTAGGGQPSQCGWLKDKFGLSWQIVPPVLLQMMRDEDRARAERVTNAMMQMGKLDIATLRRAYEEG